MNGGHRNGIEQRERESLLSREQSLRPDMQNSNTTPLSETCERMNCFAARWWENVIHDVVTHITRVCSEICCDILHPRNMSASQAETVRCIQMIMATTGSHASYKHVQGSTTCDIRPPHMTSDHKSRIIRRTEKFTPNPATEAQSLLRSAALGSHHDVIFYPPFDCCIDHFIPHN